MSSRQAALLVHALADADKAWVLEHLPSAEQNRLQALLSELGTLGIPEDPTLIDVALTRHAAAAPVPVPTDDDSYLCGIAPGQIAQALRPESTAFVRKLLACKDWPWRVEVAAALAVPATGGFDAAQAASATAFRHCATRLLAERLRQAGAVASTLPVAARAPVARQPNTWQQRIQALWRPSA